MPFLETIEKGIKKAKDLGEISCLNGEIAIREEHRKECFTVLGERYYHSLKEGLAVDSEVLCREIGKIEEELEQLRREIRKLRRTMTCPRCGSRLTSTGAFCPVCGTELIKKGICPGCGAALDAGANYCVNCGRQIPDNGSGGG